jgi:hypothetical protein
MPGIEAQGFKFQIYSISKTTQHVDKYFWNKCVATESNVIICCNLGFSDLLNIYLLILLEIKMSVA